MMHYSNELFETLLTAFPSEDEARNVVREAGLEEGRFPINKDNMRLVWRELLDIMTKQKKLRALVQRAAKQDIAAEYIAFLNRFDTEIGVQEELDTFVRLSGLPRNELIALYYQSFVKTRNQAEEVNFDESFIFKLWSYPDRTTLVRFLSTIASHEETNPLARAAIHDWYARAETTEMLNLGRDNRINRTVLDELRGSTERPALPRRRNLMVVVEPPEHDQSDTYMVSLCKCLDGEPPTNISARTEILAKDLESYLIDKLEDALLLHGTMDKIEFYLPSSLLAKAVEPHLWKVSSRTLGRQGIVVIGISDRHVAGKKLKMIDQMNENGLSDELSIMISNLKQDERMYSLVGWARFWKDRWKGLKGISETMLDALVGQVARDDAISLERLHDTFERREDWAGVAFAFSFGKLSSAEFESLLDEVFIAGLPIIVWTQGPTISEAEAHEHIRAFLQRQIFEQYRDQRIKSAAEIVELIHRVRKDTSNEFLTTAEHLTIVLDDFDREIPGLVRAGAST